MRLRLRLREGARGEDAHHLLAHQIARHLALTHAETADAAVQEVVDAWENCWYEIIDVSLTRNLVRDKVRLDLL